MNNDVENPHDLAAEISALRKDLRTCFNRALWVFAGSVVLVCLVFGSQLKIPSFMKEWMTVGGALLALAVFLYIFGITLQAIMNARLRKRHEQESFAILSGRTRPPRRQS
ncbi:hypothetical protein [Luteolibacter luteus]|uniref:Uncharacterized protein n=1 Tax=Luteolibacter luteus TaxID=2728835 RepID=A0A858RKZ9_9BACT|nr:hypothetical protein [Luteolibacter luteus]QJE98006.1 hypothetical protein HHL09_20175 [Luteolibacter luteus]